jgi:hypothetical protein
MPGTGLHGRPHLKPQISVVKNQQNTNLVLYAIEKKIELSKPLPRILPVLYTAGDRAAKTAASQTSNISGQKPTEHKSCTVCDREKN